MASFLGLSLLSLGIICQCGCAAEDVGSCAAASEGRSMLQVAVDRSGEAPQTRQVYIDMGANWANTLRLYHDLAPDSQKSGHWEIYAFEAHPLIQPYMDKFVKYLNGKAAQPELTVIPSGSSAHLQKYSAEYSCFTHDWKACLLQKFRKQLEALRPDPQLNSTGLVHERLAEAKTPLAPDSNYDRFTFIPAAVAAENGKLHLTDLDPVKTIYGGAPSEDAPGPNHMEADVISVDTVSWMVENFVEEDYVMVKMDVEGAEFGILDGLHKAKKLHLIDLLAYECHGWVTHFQPPFTNCHDMTMILNREHINSLTEGAGYDGYDSFSTPQIYKPRAPAQ